MRPKFSINILFKDTTIHYITSNYKEKLWRTLTDFSKPRASGKLCKKLGKHRALAKLGSIYEIYMRNFPYKLLQLFVSRKHFDAS